MGSNAAYVLSDEGEMKTNAIMSIYHGKISDGIRSNPLMEIPVFMQTEPEIVIHKPHTGKDFTFDEPAFLVVSDAKGERLRMDFKQFETGWHGDGNS